MSEAERLEIEALILYCRKLRSQVDELLEETEQLKAEIRRMKGGSGKIYSINKADIQILKGRLL